MTTATDFYRFACTRCLQIHSDTVPCPRRNVYKLDQFEAAMQDEGPSVEDEDPLAPARGCFVTGPWMGLLLWVGLIGVGVLGWWFW